MAAKNVKFIGFTVTPQEELIIDEVQKRNYRMNQSEVIRLLINAGAEKLIGKKKSESK